MAWIVVHKPQYENQAMAHVPGLRGEYVGLKHELVTPQTKDGRRYGIKADGSIRRLW